ncbi:MAG: DUF192 domain-containing protein [Alphaproteobacteria bacterium]|nr:DUF192 domain-containing protein [Alphaproteobacteria bacterium]
MNKYFKIFALTLLLSGCFEENYNMTFKTINGDVNYNLEVAIKDEEQSRGLMERESLDEKGGMLFPIAPVQPVTMWMRNTKISLDLIFIGADNRIIKIIEKAEPMSIKYLTSDYPVKAVVEINGGDTAKHGIKIGQYIQSSALDKFEADYKASQAAATTEITQEPKEEIKKEVEAENKKEETATPKK